MIVENTGQSDENVDLEMVDKNFQNQIVNEEIPKPHFKKQATLPVFTATQKEASQQ